MRCGSSRVKQVEMWILISIFSLAIMLAKTKCDVQITTPKAGVSYDLSQGSAAVKVEWVVTDDAFSEKDIRSYVFTLVSGPSSKMEAMATLGTFQAADIGQELIFHLSGDVGTDGKYYIQMTATSSRGYTIHYSNKFELTGMVGNKKADSNEELSPAPETKMMEDIRISVDSASFSIPYGSQTGNAKFAPMQQQPPTKVTAVAWKRNYETSILTYYSKIRPSLDQITTITPGLSYVVGTGQNRAAPALMPSDNGKWYNPTKRLSLTPRKVNI